MSEELTVLKAVTGRLTGAGIPYMVTGSMALNYYATPRMTRDIDIVVEVAEREADRVVETFQDEFYVDREAVVNAIRTRTMFNLIHRQFVVKVDLVVRKDSEYRRGEFARRRPVTVEGWEFFVVTPEDLILSKLDWAKDSRSEIQLADARSLLLAVRGLDQDYLQQWAGRLGLLDLYQEVSR
jgi:hypothetical protein